MKIIATFIMAMSIACIAFADEFQVRLQAGRQALQTREGKAYEKELSSTIVKAIGECVPPGSPPHPGAFSLVGYVAPLGKVSSIEVQPSPAQQRPAASLNESAKRLCLFHPPFPVDIKHFH